MVDRLAIPSKELQLKIVGPIDSFLASRVQRLSINTDLPSTYIDELGNPLHAGESIDIPSVTLSFSAMDVGIDIFSVLTGTDNEAYPGAGVDISELTEVDAIMYIKNDDLEDYVKSAHARKLQVRDFSFSYSVDGESTEDYTLIGSEKRWFKNDVVVDKFTTGTTSFALSETPIALKNGNDALTVILDGVYLTEVTSGPATGEYEITGTTLTTFDSRSSQLLAIYHADPAGTNWTDISDTTVPAAVRGRDIVIELSANEIARIQSITINGNLNVTDVRELGNRNIVGYQRQVPTVEGTITVLDTDTELIDLFVTGTIGSGDTEFELGLTTIPSGISLEVQIQDPTDATSPYAILKTVYIPEINIIGDGYTSNVNNNAVQTWNWRSNDAQCVVYSGAKV